MSLTRLPLPLPVLLLLLALWSCQQVTVLQDFDSDGSLDADDCQPSNPAVHPGAEDGYGDGIDQNCDGVDGMAVDQDGDGYSNPHDCDDSDSEIYPGADDSYGDGIDQNCDGVDGMAVDQDGDGYSDAWDCDDQDPSVYPGADDSFGDGIDQNCDGVDGLADAGDDDDSNGDDDDAITDPEDCSDGLDNDLDGDYDCEDSDCALTVCCMENCSDDLDNDLDGDFDCEDSDCASTWFCLENCSDGLDNNNNGDIDCQDINCADAPTCSGDDDDSAGDDDDSAGDDDDSAGDDDDSAGDDDDSAGDDDDACDPFWDSGASPTTGSVVALFDFENWYQQPASGAPGYFIVTVPDYSDYEHAAHGAGVYNSQPGAADFVSNSQFGSTSFHNHGDAGVLVVNVPNDPHGPNGGSTDFSFGLDDFTIEVWCTDSPGGPSDGGTVTGARWVFAMGGETLSNDNVTANIFMASVNTTTTRFHFGTNSIAQGINADITYPADSGWHHWAIVSESQYISIYRDGALVFGPTLNSNSLGGSGRWFIGNKTDNWNGNEWSAYDGAIDEIRVTKGGARYSGNFTPPSSSFPQCGSN